MYVLMHVCIWVDMRMFFNENVVLVLSQTAYTWCTQSMRYTHVHTYNYIMCISECTCRVSCVGLFVCVCICAFFLFFFTHAYAFVFRIWHATYDTHRQSACDAHNPCDTHTYIHTTTLYVCLNVRVVYHVSECFFCVCICAFVFGFWHSTYDKHTYIHTPTIYVSEYGRCVCVCVFVCLHEHRHT